MRKIKIRIAAVAQRIHVFPETIRNSEHYNMPTKMSTLALRYFLEEYR